MNTKLCILSCRNFQPEMTAAIAAEGWEDVVAVAFPDRCGHPPVTWEELRSLLPEGCAQIVVFGRLCLTGLNEAPADFPPTRTVCRKECFHLVDYTRALLAREVSAWRLQQQEHAARDCERRHARELADQVSAMDMLARLAKTQNEADAIALIEELFYMLFAPGALYYLRVENDIPAPDASLPADVLQTLQALPGDYAWTAEQDGFMLRIGHDEETLGLIAVEHLAFPQYRERYLNLALAFKGVCGLAIENARNRRRLLEAEKMASLGMLVAGVAHEINTPLGVGLTAASTLQTQSRRLAQRFAERSMTQSDLSRYLNDVQSSTDLLLSNLERIGQLVDTFRQVAVDGQVLEMHDFKLRQCIDEVVHSLNLPDERVTLHIDCDAQLEIHSVFTDWVSIFVNLLGNSLKHGFKNRDHGHIAIRVERDNKKMRVDYTDDGAGLSAEALARVFEPFYSTDLQHGMGLGMHLVYNLINHRLGGGIQCESRPGQGVHFHIEIPQ